MDANTQKKVLYVVGGALAVVSGWLQQEQMLPPQYAVLIPILAWAGGLLKGKAMPAPGASTPPPLPKE